MPASTAVEAITFDAYNTLFDITSDAFAEMRTLFPDQSEERLRAIWEAMGEVVQRLFADFHGKSRRDFPRFLSLDEIHRACFADAAERFGLRFEVDAAVERWNRYIAGARLYDDARAAVAWAAARYPVGIVSDIDTWMLKANLSCCPLPIEHVITSEEDRSYKAMADCTMFQTMARMLGCPPENLLHVGDSPADVYGARRVGAKAVWLNRSGAGPPANMPEPDAEIGSLAELPHLVESLA